MQITFCQMARSLSIYINPTNYIWMKQGSEQSFVFAERIFVKQELCVLFEEEQNDVIFQRPIWRYIRSIQPILVP